MSGPDFCVVVAMAGLLWLAWDFRPRRRLQVRPNRRGGRLRALLFRSNSWDRARNFSDE